MSRMDILFATMRRWVAVNRCLESFTENERIIIEKMFYIRDGSGLASAAKATGLTKERVRQKCDATLKILCDMLVSSDEVNSVESGSNFTSSGDKQ